MIRRRLLALLAAAAPVAALAEPPAPRTARPEPRAETVPVAGTEDSADDPAIWVHPTDPDQSLILGTNKKGGLHVYDLAGAELQTIDPESRPNNVDVIYDARLNGRRYDLAVATSRHKKNPGLRVYRIDPATRRLVDLTGGKALPVLDGREPYGICGYRSRRTDRSYVFVNHKSGRIHQYELFAAADGTIGIQMVRLFGVVTQPEGLVADEELGVLYAGEEDVGIWKFGAEPDSGTVGVRVAAVGENGLKDDVEGLALYCGTNGRGYLIASSQGNDTFKVYDRQTGEFLMTIDPAPGKLGKPRETDGIAVCNRPLGRQFPQGVFVVQDGKVDPADRGKQIGQQNFKLYGWEEIAGDRLLIDTQWNPRMPRPAAAVATVGVPLGR